MPLIVEGHPNSPLTHSPGENGYDVYSSVFDTELLGVDPSTASSVQRLDIGDRRHNLGVYINTRTDSRPQTATAVLRELSALSADTDLSDYARALLIDHIAQVAGNLGLRLSQINNDAENVLPIESPTFSELAVVDMVPGELGGQV